jgi:hypothetical protein
LGEEKVTRKEIDKEYWERKIKKKEWKRKLPLRVKNKIAKRE